VEFFPLIHEVADLPHQGLVAVDHRLGAGAIFVEAGSRHLLLDLPDCRFRVGDARFERGDPGLPRARAFCFLRASASTRFFSS
jgi:hypothetical protein